MLKMTKPKDASFWKTIEQDGDSLEVLIKRPTLRDILDDSDSDGGTQDLRLRKCLLNWRGVDGDDGNPLPFSYPAAFDAFAFQFPLLARRVIGAVNLAYVGLGEDSPNPDAASVP